MRLSILTLLGTVFVLLIIGLLFSSGAVHLEGTRQITNPEGSTLDMTDNQGAMLVALAVVVLGSTFGMGVAIYAIFWFLSWSVNRVQQEPNQPVKLLAVGGGEQVSVTELVANNALYIVIGLGGAMTLIVLILLLT